MVRNSLQHMSIAVNKSLMKWLGILFGLLIGHDAMAQFQITITDAANSTPLAYAHIMYAGMDGQGGGMALTDDKGRASIPMLCDPVHARILLRITFVGYSFQTDTVNGCEDKYYALAKTNVHLNEVVITAQYAPNNPEKAVHRVRIIDAKKIEAMAATSLNDVLRNELNTRLTQDPLLGSSLSLQGIGGENIKIMIDGVPIIGRLNGSVDLSQVNLLDVERIEIVDGPLSVSYGSNALAGTINIITRQETKTNTSVTASSYNENIGTFNLATTASTHIKRHRISLGAGRNFFDGWSAHDDFLPTFASISADTSRFKSWKPRQQKFASAQYNYRLNKGLLTYRAQWFDEQITNRGLPLKPYLEAAFDDYFYTSRIDNAITLSARASSLHLNITGAYNYFQRIKNTYRKDLVTLNQVLTLNPGDQDTSRIHSWMSRGSASSSRDSSWFNFEAGYDLISEQAKGQRIENLTQQQTDVAVFASAEINPVRGLLLRPGARIAYNSAYQAPLIPALNLRYQFKNITLRAAVGKGFRSPSIKELYFYFVDVNHHITGNTQLTPETSFNTTASILYKSLVNRSIYQYELTVFRNNMKNLITLAQNTPASFTYINVGTYKTQGANAVVSLLWRLFKFSAGVGITGRLSSKSWTPDSEKFQYSPECKSSLVYEWQPAGFAASFFYKYQGQLNGFALGTGGEVVETYIGDYHTADFLLSKSVMKQKIKLGTGLKNIFNVTDISANTIGGVHQPDGTAVPVSTGRLLFVKLDLKIEK